MQRLQSLIAAARQSILVWATQAGIQFLGIVSGILIVRSLPTEQYAYYTIAITSLGAMTAISDGGLNNGLLALGGKVWTDRARLGAVMASGFRIRRRMTLVVCSIALPVMWLLLSHQGATPAQSSAIVLSLLPFLFLSVESGVWEVVPRLHQQLASLQANQLVLNACRAVLVVAGLAAMPLAGIALLVPAIPQLWVYGRVRRLASRNALPDVAADPASSRDLASLMGRSLPDSIYFAFSGQLTVWLIAVFGHTDSIAAVGALGRIAMVFSAITSTFALLVLPRFARIPGTESSRIKRHYWYAQLLVTLACLVPLAAICLKPGWVIALLGSNYAGLEAEARLMALGGAMGTLSGAAFSLGAVRGILVKPWIAIPSGLVAQGVLIAVLPLGSISGVILLGMLHAAFQWALNVVGFSVKLPTVMARS